MAIKISGTTVIDDSRNLTNIAGGAIIGVQSGGVAIGTGATTINFTGSGNDFSYNDGTKTLSISISGGSGGGGVGGITTSSFFANPNSISTSFTLDSPNINYFVVGPVTVASGSTITVGAGNTFRVL